MGRTFVISTLPNCTCGALRQLNDLHSSDHLMDFLQGLNDSYATIRSNILLMDPLPSVHKACALLSQEERQRSVSDKSHVTIEQSAMASTRIPRNNRRSHDSRPQYRCEFCKKDNHLESRCYRKHGYPPGHPRHVTSQNINGNVTSKNNSRSAQQLVRDNPYVFAATSSNLIPSGSPFTLEQVLYALWGRVDPGPKRDHMILIRVINCIHMA
ncbi:hypothetical protein BUALT_Bualt03G0139800 [Buddleja alternifolia]|uniref:Uncharacterized protein n=1 Tax=Buddleja alternifolia TaxID=168488 RepID=A0AAV6XTL5_9LAMI|nr:hypothetical protein BUALT_Bualt03G0139800 [Buddleja alternifolia]